MATIIYKVNKNYSPSSAVPPSSSGEKQINFDAKSPSFFINPDDVPIGSDYPEIGDTTTGIFYAMQSIPIIYYELENLAAKMDLAIYDPDSEGEIEYPIHDPSIDTLSAAMQSAEAAAISIFAKGYVLENLVVIGKNIKEGQEFPYTNLKKGLINIWLTIISCPCSVGKFGNLNRYTITATNLPMPTFEEFQREKLRQIDFPNIARLPKVLT